MTESEQEIGDRGDNDNLKTDKLFILKKWNAVAMWSWDVECDTCAICRVQVMVLRFGMTLQGQRQFLLRMACIRAKRKMHVSGARRKVKRTIADKTAWSFGANAIIRFTTAACRFGCNKTIVVHYASKSGRFNEWENNLTNREKRNPPSVFPVPL